MVGLPARGKTYISKKLSKYLNWMRIKTNVFNIGNYRRLLFGASEIKPDFFDPDNKEGVRQRNQCAFYALKDLC
jgi:tRNA uridine 5-carbamoylmethylation protein Kti12